MNDKIIVRYSTCYKIVCIIHASFAGKQTKRTLKSTMIRHLFPVNVTVESQLVNS